MAYTLSEAAKATGLSKSTILRALQDTPAKHGKPAKPARLSGARSERDGIWLIEAAELHRLYPPIVAQPVRDAAKDEARNTRAAGETAVLRELLADREATIEDLRTRLDREGDERRQAQARLTALLTDQRPVAARGVWWWVMRRTSGGRQ
jgi:hypothetical protein